MAVVLRGNLQDFGIADVFQLVGQQRKTGVLEFTGTDDRQVQLRFDRGAVVSASPAESRDHECLGEMLIRCGCFTRAQVDALRAECEPSGQSLPRFAVDRGAISEEEIEKIEDLLTRETIFEVLRWSDGSFDFRNQRVFHRRAFETLLGAEQILMDGLRMVDEWHSFADLVPSDDIVFQRVGCFEAFRDRASTSGTRNLADIESIFNLVDGRLKVRRIIDLSRLGSFDATRALAALHDAGAIAVVDVDSLKGSLHHSLPTTLPRANARGWIATLVPVLLLGCVTGAIAWRHALPPPAGVIAIPPSALTLVRDNYASQRVIHALEVYRLVNGSWPDRLERLAEQGILTRSELASDQGHLYYYAERAEGAVLLAPEH